MIVVLFNQFAKGVFISTIKLLGLAATFINNPAPLSGLPLLFLLQFLSGLLTEQQPKLLLALWGHETLLLLLSALLLQALADLRLPAVNVRLLILCFIVRHGGFFFFF